MTKNNSYQRYFSNENKFNGKINLSDEMTKSSESVMSVLLRQTNLKNETSVNNYCNENVIKASEILSNSYFKNPEIFDSIFGFELFENYQSRIKDQFHLQRYKPILSNKNQICYLLDELTEIFYTKGYSFNGLEHIWIIFISSLQGSMDKLEEDQKNISFVSKEHRISLKKRSVPYNWGWFEFHIENFVDSFIITLSDFLYDRTKLKISTSDLEDIYEFSEKILEKLREVNQGIKDSRGFSILSEYINDNMDLLANAARSYKKYKIRTEKIISTINVNQTMVNQNIQNNTFETTINNIFETTVTNNNTFVRNEYNSITYESKKPENTKASNKENQKNEFDCADKHSNFENLTEKLTTFENQNTEFENTLDNEEPKIDGEILNDFIDILMGSSRKERESVFSNIIATLPKGLISIQKEGYCWNGKVINSDLAKTKIGMYIYPFYHKCYANGLINFDKLPLTDAKQKIFVAEIIRKTFSIPNDIRISPAQFSKIEPISLKREFRHYLTPFEKIPRFSENLFFR